MDAVDGLDLNANYNREAGRVFLTGIQALVRLPLMQRRLDRKRGLKTAGLISGYRGSPLGAYDQQLWKAQQVLSAHDILFQPGLNEDLAATALWGAQMHRAFGASAADGVFGIWYGKGNGVDRCGDVFRNANMLGTSALGGVLAVAGDDHAAQSSMFPHQTDGIFESVHMPVLQPANVEEILSLGLAGIALSRFSGLWVAMKTIAEVVESAASFHLPESSPIFLAPEGARPAHGLNWDPSIEWPRERAEYERRLLDERLPAAVAWAAANRIDRPVIASRRKRFCIVTVGKAHQDLMQALAHLGIDAERAEALGLSVYKVGMSWPLAADPLLDFALGADEIFVVEEKSPTVENQIKTSLFNTLGPRPQVTGKTGAEGRPLLPAVSEFSPLIVAKALVARLGKDAGDLERRLADWQARAEQTTRAGFPSRKPFFCAGCPHNSSTATPEGSIAGGGIGCHVMALSVPKLKTSTFSQMGGEGLQWVGAAPFSQTRHIFQNLGDGTYQHSGLLAVRAAVAAGTNITFKILYNDAVAMTGGQPAEGAIDPARIVDQLSAEGVHDIWLVSDDPGKWRHLRSVSVAHRAELDTIQRRLRETPGVTAIVFEQTCAAEKRRRRKRGTYPDPPRRLFINPRVCEGCGDCSVQSNCIAVQPLPTRDGVKRRIDQSACNKDFSCSKGFCPSFVEVDEPVVRRPDPERIAALESGYFSALPDPALPGVDTAYNIYVAGIGGLGVLTVGALLGSAAHLDGLEASVLDFTGLAQKNGAVVSEVRIRPAGAPLHAVRIGGGETHLLIGTDSVVASSPDAQRKFSDRGALVLNVDETPTADFVTDRDAALPTADMTKHMMERAGSRGFALRATCLAEGLFGSNIAANLLMVGYAWQKGLVPLSRRAIDAAIAANGAAVALNKRAFDWGRLAAIDLARVEQVAGLQDDIVEAAGNDDTTFARARDLAHYQDRRYAERYSGLMRRLESASASYGERGRKLVAAASLQAYRLMAYKDEYEVARLYSEPAFLAGLKDQFSDYRRLSVHLAPPLLSRRDPNSGRPRKRRFGTWIFTAMALLARAKKLRGTPFDPFGRTSERRTERMLRDEYLETVRWMIAELSDHNIDEMIELAALPDMIRGFGSVKEAAIVSYRLQRSSLRSKIERASQPQARIAVTEQA
ncbi:indolepyruvate ferredoxin oxidoreductase [Sphingopyxis sp. OAS728]|uniref:indolepyruvate ferredoxin oxidoreductase family protein n=1 Tax=Sphingopyxis sp. OAS728 TaxID=2663823 RepID=UPI00178BE955|nr:indolepyruvate ferredoxin oxidoreductase family protein [Sphingopyxis sp. OAS728]MBE1527996.1 indolepyruvate ferredoxin oxidoreductase [Sphingopyxis sp. OAS728]